MNQIIKTFLVVGCVGVMITTLVVGLGSALLPLLIAFGLAYLSFPILRRLEKYKIKRVYAVSGVFAFFAVTFFVIMILLVPPFVEDGRDFLHELPQITELLIKKVEVMASTLGFTLNLGNQGLRELLVQHSSNISSEFVKTATGFFGGIFSNLIKGILLIINLFLIPLFFFHLMNKYETIIDEAKNLVPVSWRSKVREYATLINTVLSGYIRGQILVAVILFVLYGISFSIIGLRFGLLIGICTGLLSIIPVLGGIIGFLVAIVVALVNYTGPEKLIAIVAIIGIIQGLEGFIITPKLVGDKVGLGALSTMLALIIGGNLLGLIGMVIAIPVAAIMKSVFKELRAEYQKLDIYQS